MRLIKNIIIKAVLCLFVCCISENIVAQINLSEKNKTIREIIHKIEKGSDYNFFFNNAMPGLDKKVSIQLSNSSIESVLNSLLKDTDITYTVKEDKQVVLTNLDIPATPNSQTQSQSKRKITGTVLDERGEPVIGANVVEKGTTNGVITNLDGEFSLTVSDKATLQISYIGYQIVEVRADNRGPLSITLREDTEVLDEVVVVGYGSQLKKTVTGAISSVKSKDIEAPNAVSADNLLQGKVAGLNITQNSAQPGSGMSVNIRGALSPNGSNSPLYVIDGVIISSEANKAAKVGPSGLLGYSLRDGSDRSPLATLNPNDIASIDVLKDASATAIYGSSAANGVILITTKKGQSGKPKVTYSGSFSVQGINKYYDMLNAQDFMNLANLGMKEQWLYINRYAPYGPTSAPSSGWSILYDEEQLKQTESYKHFDEITRTGLIHNHNVSFNAGSENFKIYASFNYFNQASIMKTTDMERFSGRINMEAIFSKRLKLNIASMYTLLNANNPSSGMWRGNANEANQTNAALYFSPRLPLQDEYNNLTLAENAQTANPLAWSYMKDKTTTKRIMFAPNLELNILPGLKANVQLSIDKTDENRDVFSPTKSRMVQQTQQNFGGYSNAYNNNYGIEEYLTYDKLFGNDHRLNVVAGTGYYVTSGNNYSVTVFNFPSDALENNYLELSSDVEETTYNSGRWERNKLSYFGRFNYTFKDRYTIGGTLRNDGSSVFAANHKWGWFPGVSAAWTISEENFMKKQDVLNFLKVRFGVGTSGNESILTGGNYSLTTYGMATGAFYYYNGSFHKGIIQKQKGNKELKWETDVTLNAGLDFSLFNDRLTGSFDYYVRTAKDLLDFTSLPATDMVATLAKNVGSTRSKGFELGLKGVIMEKKNFDWNAYLNISHNRSYWVERNPEVDLPEWVKENDDLAPIYGWKTNGIFQSPEEVQQYTSNGKVLQPDSYAGNKKYVDINGDGVLDDEDIVKLGNAEPNLYFGLGTNFRIKNVMIDIDTYGVLGRKTYDQWQYRGLADSKINTSYRYKDVWTSFNTSGWWPGIAPNPTANNNKAGNDDFSLQNTNYWRFKDIKVTYLLPQNWLKDNKIASNAAVYVDLQNTLLLTNYQGLDPEMEQNAAPFPIPFTVVLGVDITF
ncbi:SusC/RagA family TonB-linked outer membrane protein [Parabacteroides sp. PF5-6]|uniref:SusC/RagA family TonB-linked outer membrane protein n=1 Tax=Parabacteroides sp. PF5-6 TaxID=1742403 RepID=UPI002404DD1A|nr:SusC/RagA family TonB-linked outer membrane protein [Parabacteroides sp. PF5-6]MDF9828954.1 TonB-linked SusC/RagA family outer membrane protein [Parabacteroides sp. PF5-6]